MSELSPSTSSDPSSFLGTIYAQAGNRTEALAIIKKLEEGIANQKKYQYGIARIYARLGEKDKAFAWLEKAFQDHFTSMIVLKTENDFEPLRSDPRYKDLLKRMGLPE